MNLVVDQINGKAPVVEPPPSVPSTKAEELYGAINRVVRSGEENRVGHLLLRIVPPSILDEGKWTTYSPYQAAYQACLVRKRLRLGDECRSLRVLIAEGLVAKDLAFTPLIALMRMPIGAERFHRREKGGPITLVMEMKPSGVLLAITSTRS